MKGLLKRNKEAEKAPTRHFYLVTWEAVDNMDQVIKGRTEVSMPNPWGPEDVHGVINYISSLNDGGVGEPIPINIFYIGEFEVEQRPNA